VGTPEDDGPVWRKSRRSNESGGNCVEVMISADGAHVRDSQGPENVVLSFSRSGWADFLAFVKADEGAS
jgi:hypothetical protein